MTPSKARMTMPTTPIAYSGRGCCNGIAAQLRLPSNSASCTWRQRPLGLAGLLLRIERRLVDNALEQFGVNRTIGRRRNGLAWLRQRRIGENIERRSRAAHLSDPVGEIGRGHRLGNEPHIGEAVATEI